MAPDENAWQVQAEMMEWSEGNWREPDEGIWEVRDRGVIERLSAIAISGPMRTTRHVMNGKRYDR